MSDATSNPFFDHLILNSPYTAPRRYWELDDAGQPTQQVVERRRLASFVTPIPKPRQQGASQQLGLNMNEGLGLSSEKQTYSTTSNINEIRKLVDRWRMIPEPARWGVSPETQRLLQYWRHHDFTGVRPFFCQVEAVETAIWIHEVAPNSVEGRVARGACAAHPLVGRAHRPSAGHRRQHRGQGRDGIPIRPAVHP